MNSLQYLPPEMASRFHAVLTPMLQWFTRRMPGDMEQVLHRAFGDLAQWIDIDTRCGCLVGTIALVLKYDGHIDRAPVSELEALDNGDATAVVADALVACTLPTDPVRLSIVDEQMAYPGDPHSVRRALRNAVIELGTNTPEMADELARWWTDNRHSEYTPPIPDTYDEEEETLYSAFHPLAGPVVEAFCKSVIRQTLREPRTWMALQQWRATQAWLKLTGRGVVRVAGEP